MNLKSQILKPHAVPYTPLAEFEILNSLRVLCFLLRWRPTAVLLLTDQGNRSSLFGYLVNHNLIWNSGFYSFFLHFVFVTLIFNKQWRILFLGERQWPIWIPFVSVWFIFRELHAGKVLSLDQWLIPMKSNCGLIRCTAIWMTRSLVSVAKSGNWETYVLEKIHIFLFLFLVLDDYLVKGEPERKT